MTPLGEKIKAIIHANGPISVTDYFALCLADPDYGYYKTRDPFGRGGDFVTAPEVSQLFGEMIGIFLVEAWQRHLMPQRAVRIAEIGPGRGTMMADILRVISRLAPDLYEIADVHLVETSPFLTDIQVQTLVQHRAKIHWHQTFDQIPGGFLLLVGNEFFDAVPIRQFVKTSHGFRERLVGVDGNDELIFAAGAGGVEPSLLPHGYRDAPLGAIAEIAPARSAVMQAICDRLFNTGGTALFLDYGHLQSGLGDTLQAVLNHGFDPPLANPGKADLTSHVDFAALAEVARDRSVHVNGMMMQGDFLLALGIAERAGALGSDKDAATRAAIQTAVERLVGDRPGEMGELFKAIAVSSPEVRLQPFEK